MAYKSSYDKYRRNIQQYISAQKQKGIQTYELSNLLANFGTEKQMRQAGYSGSQLAALTRQLKNIAKNKNTYSSVLSLNDKTFTGSTKQLQAQKRNYNKEITNVVIGKIQDIYFELNREPEKQRLRNGKLVNKWPFSIQHGKAMAQKTKNLLDFEINKLATEKYNGNTNKAKQQIGQWFIDNVSPEELTVVVYDHMINYESVDAQISAANKVEGWIAVAAGDISQNYSDINEAFETLNEAESYDDSFEELPF